MTRQSKEPQQESMWFEDAREAKDPVDRVEEERIIKAALGILEGRCSAGEVIENPRAVSRYLQLRLAPLQNECFAALYLDTRHRVLAFREHFHGTIDGAAVYPRVIVKAALELNAAAVILTHNHPSGSAEPSEADRNITTKLSKALALVDIRILDHIVVSARETVSLAERGYL